LVFGLSLFPGAILAELDEEFRARDLLLRQGVITPAGAI